MTTQSGNGKTSLNLELLIKLLKMTTSSNDAEALLASRKANEQLLKFGGDWEALLHGKVTVIADPFTAPPPTVEQTTRRAAPPPPPPPRPAPPPPPPKPKAPPPPRQPTMGPGSWSHIDAASRAAHAAQTKARATHTAPQPAMSRNTLRKQRVQLDDLA
jgi:hypothetical protein